MKNVAREYEDDEDLSGEYPLKIKIKKSHAEEG